MSTTSIKISQLNSYPGGVTGSDFIPIDKSSSLTTVKTTLSNLQAFFSTGSFTGSFAGRYTGSFFASSGGRFFGTASYASTASYTNTASVAISASYAPGLTNLQGAGTANTIPIWGTTYNLTDSLIQLDPTASAYTSYGKNLAVQVANARLIARSTQTSTLSLESNNTSSDRWDIVVGTTSSNTENSRGRLELITYTGSNNLSSKQSNDPYQDSTVKTLRLASNGFYFWPLYTTQSVSKDGTLNVGVDSTALNTSSRVLIDVFSGSSAANPQTYHLRKALEIRYGSGSMSTVFCVSSSGQVIASSYSGSNFNVVSFFGTSSNALTSSRAITSSFSTSGSYALTSSYSFSSSFAFSSSYALTGSYALSSSFSTTASLALLGVSSIQTSITQSCPAAGSTISSSHGLGSAPKYNKWVLVNNNVSGSDGFSFNDEVDVWIFVNNTGGNPYPQAFNVWADSTKTYLRHAATAAGLTVADWKAKAYYSS